MSTFVQVVISRNELKLLGSVKINHLKFPENMSNNRFRNVFNSVQIFVKLKYYAKPIIFSKFPDHDLIYYLFTF